MQVDVDRIFNVPPVWPNVKATRFFTRFPNIYKTSDGSAVRDVDYNYNYFPLPRNSFVRVDGITQKIFPQTHWYAPNRSNVSYRRVCMNAVTTPYSCG